MHILDRVQLTTEYNNILKESGLEQNGNTFIRHGQSLPIALQSTSGSRNAPLLIPRTQDDITDLFTRIFYQYTKHYNVDPHRIALIGGISHMEAARTLRISGKEIRNFELSEIEDLIAWCPDLLSCYPSVLRLIFGKYGNKLAFLKGVKTGGERLFPADCERVFSAFPELLLIEQYGSTELPALAFRNITKYTYHINNDQINVPFEFQTVRFSFLNNYTEGWHPIIAKDNFKDLAFKIDGYYDTGDEAFWSESKVIDIRRRKDQESIFWPEVNRLFRSGITNCQINLKERLVLYEGSEQQETKTIIFDEEFLLKMANLKRIPTSNKLPLIVS